MIESAMQTQVIKRLLASSITIMLAACGQSEPPAALPKTKENQKIAFNAADEALYMKRFEARGKSQATGLPAYDPLATVAGAENYIPFKAAKNASIKPSALQAAHTYVEDKNTSALMIWRNGALETETYFGDNTADSLLVSRSLAKPISVIAVGRALQEGHINSLDQPVSDFITEWQGTDKAKILVRHLLDMRSGLLPQDQALEPDHVLNRAYMHPRHDEVIIHEYPLVDKPGTRYDYANATSELVAPLIERATGVPYEEWVSREILKPLGAKGGQIWMNREGGTPHSGCCILLPADSYLRLAVLYIKDGVWGTERLLPEGFVNEVRTATPQNPHSGMGVYVAGTYTEKRGPLNPDKPLGQILHSAPYLADDLYLFDGNGHQTVYIIPSANMVVLRTGGWMPKGLVWDNSQLPNTLIEGITFPPEQAPIPQKYRPQK